jgi:glycosyltransferase involved in cell wall biosynthesis
MPKINKTAVCIDARLFGIAHTGIGRYTQNLILNLPARSRGKVSLIVTPENFGNPALAEFKRYSARYHPYSPLAQLEMLWLWWQIRPGLFHATHSSIPVLWPGKMVVTFHDLIKHISRGKDTTTKSSGFYWIKYAAYLLIDRIAIRRAVKIIVPSRYWKERLMEKYGLGEGKIAVTYEGAGIDVKPAEPPPDFGIKKPFAVYTGNLYPHKNVGVLLRAVKILRGRINLAIVCARSVFTQKAEDLVRELGVSASVKFMGRLSDADLGSLYQQAAVFVFPSLIEGFGLPGLEAMAWGLPVVAAKASCLPEIYQDAAMYFNGVDPGDLAGKITRVSSDSALRRDLIAKGLKQVKKYSWALMAKQTWKIYQNALL